MAISLLPASPSRADDPVNFSTKADAFVAALPTFVSETNATATQVDANASAAAVNAATAVAKAAEAVAAATSAAGASGASKWVSSSYSEGATAWSPINYQTYRARTTGSKPTDPSLDATNWALVSAGAINHFVLISQGII